MLNPTNLRLKAAILSRYRTQSLAALHLQIRPSRLSQLINGLLEPGASDLEKFRLAFGDEIDAVFARRKKITSRR